MKQYSYLFAFVLLLSTLLTSCELIEGVFKAGFYAAIILIVLLIGLIIWLINRFRR